MAATADRAVAATAPVVRRQALATGLGTIPVLEVVAAVTFCMVSGWSWRFALENFVVTNALMGASFAICGTIIARHRPRNPIGWLFIAHGLGHATTAMAAPLAQVLVDGGAPLAAQRLAVTVFSWSWPWSVGLFLPLALLLFPDGRLPSPRWRLAAVAVVATAPLFALELGAVPEPLYDGLPIGYLTLSSYYSVPWLWTAAEIRTVLAVLIAVAALVVRFRRADDTGRRRLLWLLLATILVLLFMVPWSFVAGTPIAVLFAFPLIPAAVTLAIVRHQLLDIRLVVSRALTWALLSLTVLLAYAGLVALLDGFVSSRLGRSAVVTVIIALLVAPVLPRLQRLVDRAMYGDRRDAALVASRVGEQLAGGGLAGVAAAIREALRMPYVEVRAGSDVLAAAGSPDGRELRAHPLVYGDQAVGELRVGLRPGERELTSADRSVLALVAAPLAVALQATRLSADLQASREHLVTARAEERRRLRRDLHDGLGPTLTGVALTADAAANLLDSDPAGARSLLAALRSDTRGAIRDVRRLIEDLRPPALDDLGLAGALRQRAERTSWRSDGAALRVRVDLPDKLPTLPAAIEVAVYRIATEALTNVVRHSRASTALLRLRCGVALELEVLDDGVSGSTWHPGVGLRAMRERTAELGGSFDAGPTPTGGRVFARLPLEAL